MSEEYDADRKDRETETNRIRGAVPKIPPVGRETSTIELSTVETDESSTGPDGVSVGAKTVEPSKQAIAADLTEPVVAARELATKLGLDPYPVRYWIVDHDEMNRLIAYGGFDRRYPHWRWGMAYDRQRKQDRYTGARAFEIVNNDNPAHAFLQASNSMADQKAVITHVEAHADFFANNEWFGRFSERRAGADEVDAAAMLARHARTIERHLDDPDVDREDVERWIDTVRCLMDTIDQHRAYVAEGERTGSEDETDDTDGDVPSHLGISEAVTEAVFGDWDDADTDGDAIPGQSRIARDLLAYLRDNGKRYDPDEERAMALEPWQRDVIDVIREEAYYFAPQRLTKVMNEGWAAYWESKMMGAEAFADDDEFLSYADHLSKVLGSSGLNPYRLGLALWRHIENVTNRRAVVEALLRVDGIDAESIDDYLDDSSVLERLEPPAEIQSITPDSLDALENVSEELIDHEALEAARAGEIDVERYPWRVLSTAGLVRRHYSLVEPANRRVLSKISSAEIDRIDRYLLDRDRYASVDDALDDLEFSAGWNRLLEVRESHNDVTFIEEFLTPEFVLENNLFTYEHSRATDGYHVASTDPEDVKRKLLLQFTNFGSPTVAVYDGNYDNAGELLLCHEFNGVDLDVEQARAVLERVFALWGRPVNLLTIRKEYDDHDVEVARRRNREPTPEEQGIHIRYDGRETTVEQVPWETVSHLAADDVDYDTKPEEWLA